MTDPAVHTKHAARRWMLPNEILRKRKAEGILKWGKESNEQNKNKRACVDAYAINGAIAQRRPWILLPVCLQSED